MRIVVPLKAVPDLVEEIEFTPDGTGIDREFLKFVLNEWDDQALEEALLIKDTVGGEVIAVGLADDPDIDQALYTALAKGADSAVKISGDAEDTHCRAALLAAYLEQQPADLIGHVLSDGAEHVLIPGSHGGARPAHDGHSGRGRHRKDEQNGRGGMPRVV